MYGAAKSDGNQVHCYLKTEQGPPGLNNPNKITPNCTKVNFTKIRWIKNKK